MGVLTHLDTFKNKTRLQKVKKQMKQRFWTEVYQGAKLFYLSGMVHSEYQKTEVHNLGNWSDDCRVARWVIFKPKITIWVNFGGP
jgi:ribosome biogenesis protein BMS1